MTVSYTHLDVYKRQTMQRSIAVTKAENVELFFFNPSFTGCTQFGDILHGQKQEGFGGEFVLSVLTQNLPGVENRKPSSGWPRQDSNLLQVTPQRTELNVFGAVDLQLLTTTMWLIVWSSVVHSSSLFCKCVVFWSLMLLREFSYLSWKNQGIFREFFYDELVDTLNVVNLASTA